MSCLLLVALALPARAAQLTVCSFNIQFLGQSTLRNDEALADVVKGFDLVIVQEVVAPPYPGKFPDGTAFKPDPQSAQFFDAMQKHGFEFWLSEEDTGKGKKIHNNGSATEWWVAFFNTNAVKIANNLPHGFLDTVHAKNKNFDRVPYAFSFRTKDNRSDFVLISVHLRPGEGEKARRKHELASIASWIQANNQQEKDFIILGDMNIENVTELQSCTPAGFRSLNDACEPTNTNIKGPKPYDHVMFALTPTGKEIDLAFGFKVINLVTTMKPFWHSNLPYPGNPYHHDNFRKWFSDHHPVHFRIVPLASGDDD